MTPPSPSAGAVRPLGRYALHVLVASALSWAATSALAEHWVDLPPATDAGWLQWDRDSAAPLTPDRFAAAWRVGSAPGHSYAEQRGSIDCLAESLQLGTSSYVDTDTGAGQYGTATTDYSTGTRLWRGHRIPLSEAERLEAFEFPVQGSAGARLIEAVCASRPASASPGRAPVAWFDFRLGQAAQACRLNAEQVARLRTAWSRPAGACAVASATGCGAAAASLEPVTAGVSNDLARAAAGLSCTYLPATLAQAVDEDAQRAASGRFQACVARVIPELDDRVSDAEVVANGVFGACRSELPAEVAQGPLFANGLLPRLTAAVLKNRNAGRISLPSRPTRPQSE